MVTRQYTVPSLPIRSSSSEQAFIAEASVTVAGPAGKNPSDGSSAERSDGSDTCSSSSDYGRLRYRPGLTYEQARARDVRYHAANSSAGYCYDVDVIATNDVDDHDDDITYKHDDDVVVDANIVADDDGDDADDPSDVVNHGTTASADVVSSTQTSVAIASDFAYIDSTLNTRVVSHATVTDTGPGHVVSVASNGPSVVDLTVGDNDAGLKVSTLIGCDDEEQDPSVIRNASDCVKLEHIYQLDWTHEVTKAQRF